MHRRLWDCKRTFASAPTLPSPGSSVSYLCLVSLQHPGPQKVEAEPKLLSLYAPRYFGRRAHSHLLGFSCVANCIRLQSPLLDGLSAPAVEEAPSVDKQVVSNFSVFLSCFVSFLLTYNKKITSKYERVSSARYFTLCLISKSEMQGRDRN